VMCLRILKTENFGVLQRDPEPAWPRKHIHKPRLGLNDISFLSKCCYGRKSQPQQGCNLANALLCFECSTAGLILNS
jgi:hypothetical protein